MHDYQYINIHQKIIIGLFKRKTPENKEDGTTAVDSKDKQKYRHGIRRICLKIQ